MNGNQKKVRTTLNLFEDDLKFIQSYCERRAGNKSYLIRKIINDWCEFIQEQQNNK